MFKDVGFISNFAVVKDEAQTMLLSLKVGRFTDAALLDHAHDAAFLAGGVPHAEDLHVTLRPLMVRGLVADLCSRERQVRADLFPECGENLHGHPICGLPFLNCKCGSPVRQTDQHGIDSLLRSTVRVLRECKWDSYIVESSAHQVHLEPLLVRKEGDYEPNQPMIGKLFCK